MSLILQSAPKDTIVIKDGKNNEIFLRYAYYNSEKNEISVVVTSKNDFTIKQGNSICHYFNSVYGLDKMRDYQDRPNIKPSRKYNTDRKKRYFNHETNYHQHYDQLDAVNRTIAALPKAQTSYIVIE